MKDLRFDEPYKIESIDGIWDLPMLGTAAADVEQRYLTLIGGPRKGIVMQAGGTLVNQPDDGTWCELHKYIVVSEGVLRPSPAGLPDDAVRVVRTAALDDLKARVSQSSSTDSPPDTRATDGRPIDTDASPGSTAAPFDIAEQDFDTKEGRRKAVNAFLEHCNSEQPHVLRRSHIWRAAGYTDPRTFQEWQAMTPRKTRACDKNIRRLLAMSATGFLDLLSRKGLIKDE